jgi:hypothetical protein
MLAEVAFVAALPRVASVHRSKSASLRRLHAARPAGFPPTAGDLWGVVVKGGDELVDGRGGPVGHGGLQGLGVQGLP